MKLNKLMELVPDSKFRLPEDLKKYAEEKLVRHSPKIKKFVMEHPGELITIAMAAVALTSVYFVGTHCDTNCIDSYLRAPKELHCFTFTR